MELQITGTNMQLTPGMQRYIETKFNKLTKHMPDIIDIKVEVSEEGTKSPQQRYIVRAAVNSGAGGSLLHAEERAEDLQQAADKAADVLITQLEKHKGKLYDRGRGNPNVRGKFSQPEPAEPTRKIVKTKKFTIEPMTAEEAIDQMERLSHNFFIYVDDKSDEVRLIYRRKDGNYGLIQPELKMK
jgi:putative sigma-54 modulation protein